MKRWAKLTTNQKIAVVSAGGTIASVFIAILAIYDRESPTPAVATPPQVVIVPQASVAAGVEDPAGAGTDELAGATPPSAPAGGRTPQKAPPYAGPLTDAPAVYLKEAEPNDITGRMRSAPKIADLRAVHRKLEPPPALKRAQDDAEQWHLARSEFTAEALKTYLDKYPTGSNADAAKAMIRSFELQKPNGEVRVLALGEEPKDVVGPLKASSGGNQAIRPGNWRGEAIVLSEKNEVTEYGLIFNFPGDKSAIIQSGALIIDTARGALCIVNGIIPPGSTKKEERVIVAPSKPVQLRLEARCKAGGAKMENGAFNLAIGVLGADP